MTPRSESASDRTPRILQVGTADSGGGAASVALSLLRGCRARGWHAWAAVGHKRGDDSGTFTLPDDAGALARGSGYAGAQRHLRRMANRFPGEGWGWLSRSLRLATHPRALADRWMGREDFEFPGTYQLLDLTPLAPDLVHCHNLHGGYFDLRALAWLSRQVPTVLTLHDAWTLSGHCAHPFGCDRWKTGCGACPDLTIEPAIRRDATAENWARKRDIYARSRLHVATPARWLMRQLQESMLAPAVRDARVIPHGVDLSVFHPADRHAVRKALGMAPDAAIVLVTSSGRTSAWRDQQTLRAAVGEIAARAHPRPVRFVVLGDRMAALEHVAADVRVAGYQEDPTRVAQYYQAADVYVHAARADTFPSVVLEALACGTPVVATSVGGIPEQITPASADALDATANDRLAQPTGVLVPPGDVRAMAGAVIALLARDDARRLLGINAAKDARERFDLQRQVEGYLAWYESIIANWNHAASDTGAAPARSVGPERVAVD